MNFKYITSSVLDTDGKEVYSIIDYMFFGPVKVHPLGHKLQYIGSVKTQLMTFIMNISGNDFMTDINMN